YDWDSPDLVALLELMARNRSAFGPLMQGGTLYRVGKRLRQKLHPGGTRGRARRFAGHYELPNRFFECWLDPEMVYSAATYGLGNDLAAAQKAKLNRICTQMGLKQGMKLLEINCGWGSLSVLAARDYGCEVTALTLSESQLETCRKRAHGHRQDNRVDFRLEDFSAVTGTYDRIIAVEPFGMMTEADWPNFFAAIAGHLADDGLAYVETTTIRDDLFDSYRTSIDPVREYIFPGALLPSYATLDEVIRTAGLTEAGYADIGGTYVPTLKIWQRRFQTMWPEIMMLGFDNDFKRSWELFLAYAEAGFRTGDLTLREMLLAKGEAGTSG
ncbi:MAG: cyclopropane-fatty-acyl-phospholipid synthase family protein, partial [Rhodospirillales bacterium]